MKKQRKPALYYRILVFLVLAAAAAAFTGCAKKATGDVRIELESLDGKDPSASDAVFPLFVSEDDAYEKKLDKLNKEVDKIRKYYEDRRQKDKGFIVRTYVSSVKAIPQCTIFWYEEHSLLGDDYNLMTLAFDKSTGEPMTSKEALDSLEIDGIILSTNVGKLFRQMHPLLELKETEMQGFETDESGTVTCVFMKLVAQKIPDETEASESTPEEEIHFYYYDLNRESLGLISDLGYEIP